MHEIYDWGAESERCWNSDLSLSPFDSVHDHGQVVLMFRMVLPNLADPVKNFLGV